MILLFTQTEKTVQDRIANERIAAIARLQAEHKLKADSHFFENLHYEHDEGLFTL